MDTYKNTVLGDVDLYPFAKNELRSPYSRHLRVDFREVVDNNSLTFVPEMVYSARVGDVSSGECGSVVQALSNLWEKTEGLPEREMLIQIWANEQINFYVTEGGYEYADSYRHARRGNFGQLRKFVKARTCCGEEEFIKTGPDGYEYHLGFNWGH